MTGIFNNRPPIPKCTSIWDVEMVLNYLREIPENNLLSDKLITLKLTILLALTSAARASELTNLDISFLQKLPSVYVFSISKLTKTWRKGRKPPLPFRFYRFHEDKKLCVCNTIDSYLLRRASWGVSETQLLVSHIRPHDVVTTSTVSRWLCQALTLAGVDTSCFKGHSTRAASTSKADSKGLSISDIIKQGQWSTDSTFRKFYRKDIDFDNKFSNTVLTGKL